LAEREPISGKVAAILNLRELVINRGSADGVTPGMRFAVLNHRGFEIKDPDTGDVLGSVPVMKIPVEAARIEEHLTVVRTFRTTRRNVGGRGGFNVDIFAAPKWVTAPETLKLEEKPYEEELPPSELVVKVGDPVVEIVGDEFEVAAGESTAG
jgi:hypothetical protein